MLQICNTAINSSIGKCIKLPRQLYVLAYLHQMLCLFFIAVFFPKLLNIVMSMWQKIVMWKIRPSLFCFPLSVLKLLLAFAIPSTHFTPNSAAICTVVYSLFLKQFLIIGRLLMRRSRNWTLWARSRTRIAHWLCNSYEITWPYGPPILRYALADSYCSSFS